MNSSEESKNRFEMNGLDLGIRYINCPNQIRMLELITILSLITLSLSWIQDYPYKITIVTDNRLSQTDKRLSVSDNNIKGLAEIPSLKF